MTGVAADLQRVERYVRSLGSSIIAFSILRLAACVHSQAIVAHGHDVQEGDY